MEMDTLKGQLLVAMPEMQDTRFSESVILLVGHSEDGAMGLKINESLPELSVGDVLAQLELGAEEELIRLPQSVKERPVFNGGPVESGRGFVLHTRDYFREGYSIEVTRDVGMTATLDILKAITFGPGPDKSLLALGYCGWAPGQLEDEMMANSWLTVPTLADLLFGLPIEDRYGAALASIGISRASLSGTSGSA